MTRTGINKVNKLKVNMTPKTYHDGKIQKNEIVLCDIMFKHNKKIVTLQKVLYKYYKGTFSNKRLLLPLKIKTPVEVLDITVISRHGFGVDEG